LAEITASIFRARKKILELPWNLYFTLVQAKYAFLHSVMQDDVDEAG